MFRATLNGRAVTDDLLDPGWTSYGHRLRYRTFDGTTLVRGGSNAVGVVLGDGWFAGRLGWYRGGRRHIYGDRVGLVAQLEVTYDDGSRERILETDAGWTSGAGGLLSSSFYDGESFDRRAEPSGWDLPGFPATGWAPVDVEPVPDVTLVAPEGPQVRTTGEIEPVDVLRWGAGSPILDFGQVLVGRVRIRPSGPRGTTDVLRHAEVLEAGELAARPLRTAPNVDTDVLAGTGAEEGEPRFAMHGFRYVSGTGSTRPRRRSTRRRARPTRGSWRASTPSTRPASQPMPPSSAATSRPRTRCGT